MKAQVNVRRTEPQNSFTGSTIMKVSLSAPPFAIEIDPLRRDTAPKGSPKMLPPRVRRVAALEIGIMDLVLE